MIQITALDLARRFLGVHEVAGAGDHPLIRYCHSLTDGGEAPDEVAWCSSFINMVAFLLDLPRTKSKAARSWLAVDATQVDVWNANPGFDVVVFRRGDLPQPGPDVLAAPGHVALFVGRVGDYVDVCGGNQGNAVSIARFPVTDVLGIRRLAA